MKRIWPRTRARKGQTLVETSAALGVIAIVVASLVAMGIAAMRSSSYSKNRVVVDKIADESLEAMRAKKNSSLDFEGDFTNGSCYVMSSTTPRSIIGTDVCATWQTYIQAGVATPYYYKITVSSPVTKNGIIGKVVTVTARFTDSGGNRDTSVETFFTNWK